MGVATAVCALPRNDILFFNPSNPYFSPFLTAVSTEPK